MEDPQKKSLRLLLLHRLLNDRVRGYTTRELSSHLGVSRRTIERDLNDLMAPPYSLPLTKEGWFWKLDRQYAIPLPPITLTREQAAALYLGARLLMQNSGSITPLALQATRKFAEALPAEIGAYLLHDRSSVPLSFSQRTEAVFSVLVAGWIERRKVLCVHQRRLGTPHTYHLAPYRFEPSAVGYAIYVVGGCDELDGALRTFKVERILEASLTDEPFTPAAAGSEQVFSNAWRIWGGDAPVITVQVRFSAAAASRIRETVWHPTQQITELPNGCCEWQVVIAEPLEMLPWLRGWGSAAEVLAPDDLRQAVAEDARRTAQMYSRDRHYSANGGNEPIS
jgi:predicted DNA-binding transcriptional regulator YafY